MRRELSVVCDDDLAREIEALAREYGVSREEVVRQLLDLGLEELDR